MSKRDQVRASEPETRNIRAEITVYAGVEPARERDFAEEIAAVVRGQDGVDDVTVEFGDRDARRDVGDVGIDVIVLMSAAAGREHMDATRVADALEALVDDVHCVTVT